MAKILVVDDNGPLRRSLLRTLEEHGLDACGRADGESALEELVNDCYDLVISDVFMPCVDGLQLLIRIKNRYPNARVILMSGSSFEDDTLAEAAYLFGAEALLEKPFRPKDLMVTVERALQPRPASLSGE